MKIIKPDVQFITPIDGATILKRLEQRVEQVWNRCFFYICSARKPLIFKTFSVVFRERNRWNRCKYTFFL